MSDSYTADLPEVLALGPGEQVSLPLPGALGSGYTWSVSVEGDGVQAAIAFTGPELTRTEIGSPEGPPLSGSFAATRLDLLATAPGTARVQLRLARSWQPDSPLASHDLRVHVEA